MEEQTCTTSGIIPDLCKCSEKAGEVGGGKLKYQADTQMVGTQPQAQKRKPGGKTRVVINGDQLVSERAVFVCRDLYVLL